MASKNSRKKTDQFLTDNETPSLKVSANGNSATFHTAYPQKWYDALVIFYHDQVEENNPFIISHWTDSKSKDDENKLLDTIIKYINKSNREDVLTLTITLYHTSGTLLVQGAAECVKVASIRVNNKFKAWFKPTTKPINTRTKMSKYCDVKANHTRFTRSPLSYLTRILNMYYNKKN